MAKMQGLPEIRITKRTSKRQANNQAQRKRQANNQAQRKREAKEWPDKSGTNNTCKDI
jgi:hypothetical protein